MDLSLAASTFSPAEINGLAAMAWTWTAAFAPRILAALLILLLGFVVASWSRRALQRLTRRSRWVDDTVRSFLIGAVQYAIVILVLMLVLNQIGIQTSSLLAVLGAAGLAVGLALQGTLSNIAAGIMLLWLRPFRVGDYIEVNALAGTVVDTGLFACQLETFDGVRLFAPNSTIWNFALRNHTEARSRLIAFSVTLGAGLETQARDVIMAALAQQPGLAADHPPTAFLDALTDSSRTLVFRVWSNAAAYPGLQRDITDLVRSRLVEAGVQQEKILSVSRLVPAAADPTRFLG